jgi:radical SAM-linked protein
MTSEANRYQVALCLSRLGDARFLGHLDFGRLLERSLRRSGLPVRSTQGFNPRLKVSYAEALPLGMASEGEWVTLTLDEDLSPATVAEALAPCLPELLRLRAVQRGPAPPSSGRASYRLDVAQEPGSAADALTELLQRDRFPVPDARRGQPVDARAPLARGEARDGHLLVDLVAPDDRPPRPGPVLQALRQLAEQAGRRPPAVGTITKAGGPARPGEDAWVADAGVDRTRLPAAAGC